ncbi:MAG: hypothetical protein IPK58_15555 [Acidobacteria bacterium]|nr:hypothetical protein [Acidobacteriota bacterium]
MPDYQYDPAGNVVRDAQGREFQYDAENRQITATGPNLSQSYVYDPNGKRIKSVNHITGSTTLSVYDSDGDLAAEYVSGAPAAQNPTISYLTQDALGSVRVVTDSNGELRARRDFLPFGEEIPAESETALRRRNTGFRATTSARNLPPTSAIQRRILDYAQSRYYSPMLGRFTSPDEFKGGPDELFEFEDDASGNPTFYADITNPQSLNKYQYSYNNPYRFNDPDGHCPFV